MRVHCTGAMIFGQKVIGHKHMGSEDFISDTNTWIGSSYWNRVGHRRMSFEWRIDDSYRTRICE